MASNPIDLCTVQAVKNWMPGLQPADNQNTDAVLQSAITAVSLDWLRRTGRGPRTGVVPTQSPFNQLCEYTETYDGSGTSRMFVRNVPIISVSSLTVFGMSVSASTSQASPGYVVDNTGKSISLISPFRGAGGLGAGYYGNGRWPAFGLGVLPTFPQGMQNVQITYMAGYAAQNISNELQTIPALPSSWQATTSYSNGSQIFDGTYVQTATIKGGLQSATSGVTTPNFSPTAGGTATDGQYLVWTNGGLPYAVTASVLPWLANTSVAYFSSGDLLTQVYTAPAESQYFIASPGGYLFNSADTGKQVLLSYTAAGTPYDVQLAAVRMVFLTYKRRGWEGLRSMAQKDVGQTNYAAWEVDPTVLEVIENYRKRAVTG